MLKPMPVIPVSRGASAGGGRDSSEEPDVQKAGPERGSIGGSRSAEDAARVVLGVVVAVLCYLVARGDRPAVVEQNLFRLINELPSGAAAAFVAVTQLGALGAVPVFAAMAMLRRRPRLARSVLAAGLAAWGISKLIQLVANLEAPERVIPHVLLRGATATGSGFPAIHVAVAAAMATVAGAQLSRSSRRLAWLGVGAIGVARVYVGAHLPIDAAGGLGVGWATGAAALLVFRARRGLPSPARLRSALQSARGTPTLAEDPFTTGGRASWRATALDGACLHLKVCRADRDGGGWPGRAVRLVAFRELHDTSTMGSSRHRAEHEAYMSLLAERAGIRTPSVIGTFDVDEDVSIIAREWMNGTALDAVVADCVGDSFLDDLWGQVKTLHDSGISHGALRAKNIILGFDGRAGFVGIVGHVNTTGAAARQHDHAELLVATAAVVGPEKATAAALRALGRKELTTTLPGVQFLGLSLPTRRSLRAQPDLLDRLRAQIAPLTGVAVPRLQRPYRVAAGNLAPLVVGGIALYLLLPKVAHSGQALASVHGAHWGWLAITAVAALATYAMAAVSLMAAAGTPLGIRQTFVAQLAAAFANRLSPAGLGGMATNVRYLERAGADRSCAMASVGLTTIAGFIVHTLGLLIVLPLVGARGPAIPSPDNSDHPGPLIAIIAAAILVTIVLVWRYKLWKPATATARVALRSLVAVMTVPERAAALFIGSAGITMGYMLALAASMQAFGISLSIAQVAAVYLGASALAAVAPTPGGLGALEAALVGGLTTFGAHAGPAIAAVIAYRLITYWLPVIPGALSYRGLRMQGAI